MKTTLQQILLESTEREDSEPLAHVAEAVVSADDCPSEKETTAALLILYWILHNILLHKALRFNFHILYPILTQGGPAL